MLWRLHTVNHCQWLYTVLHWTQCVKLYCKMVSFSRSVWKKLHRTEKIYTASARGARDNYEVCPWWSIMLLTSIQYLIYIGCHASLTTLIFSIRDSSSCCSSVTEKDTCYGVSPCYNNFVWPSTSTDVAIVTSLWHAGVLRSVWNIMSCMHSTAVFCTGLCLRCYFI